MIIELFLNLLHCDLILTPLIFAAVNTGGRTSQELVVIHIGVQDKDFHEAPVEDNHHWDYFL